MKLIGEHSKENRPARKHRPVRRYVEVVLGVVQHAAPGRNVRREAKAEEGERDFGDDCGCHIDRAGDDHRTERIRQDVADHHAPCRGAERTGRFDELLLPQREELRAHQSRHDHPPERADRRDDQNEDTEFGPDQRLQRVAEQVHDQQQHWQWRQRQEQVGQPHQSGIHAAARHTGERADDGADDDGHRHGRQPDGQRYPAAVDHAGQQVLAEIVGAERMRQAWSLQLGCEIDVVDLGGPHQGPNATARIIASRTAALTTARR